METSCSNKIEEVIDYFAGGGIVIVRDADDRENEGDLIMGAEFVTAQSVAFFLRHTSGIICAALTEERAGELELPLMVSDNSSAFETAFTVTVDHVEVTTGISAEERALTLRTLSESSAKAGDFIRPGHVFPLIAKGGGTLTRAGHTEAAVDLCQSAGLQPVGVICELMNQDGTVMRGKQIKEFAEEFKLPIILIDDIIAYRKKEK